MYIHVNQKIKRYEAIRKNNRTNFINDSVYGFTRWNDQLQNQWLRVSWT